MDIDRDLVERLLFIDGLSIREVAEELEVRAIDLRKQLQAWGLEGEIRRRGLRSQPQVELRRVLEKLYPSTPIYSEYYLGERLYLDFYLPRYHMAYEYDGPQHTQFVGFFHDTVEGFERAQERDKRKDELCYSKGIVLVRVGPLDKISEEHIILLTQEALVHNGEKVSPELSYRDRIKQLSTEQKRARMRAMYRAAKEWKKKDDGRKK